MSRLILGLNTDHADSSAALLGENGIIAAIAEERVNRQKHSAAFPKLAIRDVLRMAGAELQDVTDIAVARDAKANFAAKAAFVARHPKSGLSLSLQRLGVHRKVRSGAERIAEELGLERSRIKAKFHSVEHHLAHLASSFYWSPFDACAGFSVDGAGDFATTMWADCRGREISVLGRSYWPHSLGVFYTALCQFIGFNFYGEEYKVMGLAAYGDGRRFSDLTRRMVRFDPRKGLRLNLDCFRHQRSLGSFENIENGQIRLSRLWSRRLEEELGAARRREDPITDRERDLAAAVQERYEEVFLQMVEALVGRTGTRNIVLAGGCALNSVANGRMLTEGYVDRAYFHPAASDDGTAVGAALHVLHNHCGVSRGDSVDSAFWGPEWREDEIAAAVEASSLPFRRLDRKDLLDTAASSIAEGKIIGWFQGREEWGPRALGNRSILCNPALPDMKAVLNARIKNREPFRPFAPAIREDEMSECFEGTHPVPFMIVVYKVRPEWRQRLPAITHHDGTGRVQTVTKQGNPLFYDLLGVFKEKSGVPVLLNTSFNENEPIVHTPAQAIDCFSRTKMDCLGIGPFWLQKESRTG